MALKRRKALSLVAPHLGGTYSLFVAMRRALKPRGWDLRFADLDPDLAAGKARRLAEGEVLGCRALDEAASARLLAGHALKHDLLVVNVLTSRLLSNVARYLPAEFPKLMVVHNFSPGTYVAAAALRPWMQRTIAVSPRIKEDLMAKYGFEEAGTASVLNGAVLGAAARTGRARGGTLRVASLGRIEDYSKGVLSLPGIWSRLPGGFTLDVYGKGPDEERLRRACAGDARIRLRGPVGLGSAVKVLSAYDAFIFPSHFEGFGLTLAEALAAGCVPVSRRIRGITDQVVRHGVDGFLFDGEAEAAERLKELAQDPALRAAMSTAGRAGSRRFSPAAYGRRLAPEFARCMAAGPAAQALPWERWEYPRGMRAGLRSSLPRWMKRLGYRLLR